MGINTAITFYPLNCGGILLFLVKGTTKSHTMYEELHTYLLASQEWHIYRTEICFEQKLKEYLKTHCSPIHGFRNF